MGEHNDTMNCQRTIFNEKGDNGLLISGSHIPPELLTEIFCRVELKSLLNCHLVCKRWKILIQSKSYVWRKKAEMTVGKLLPRQKEIPWQAFYHICKKKPFERNLLKNLFGQKKYGHDTSENGDRLAVENPSFYVPELPSELVFKGGQVCFVTSYEDCIKQQDIDLVAEGFHPCFLDVVQPPIMVSVWLQFPSYYDCHVRLLAGIDDCTQKQTILDEYRYRNTMGTKSISMQWGKKWRSISHVFENYGCGLRKINFMHGGINKPYWAKYCNTNIAGAGISVKVPPVQYDYDDELDPFLNE